MSDAHPAQLRVEPRAPTVAVDPGLHPLGLGAERDGVLYVPDVPGPRPLLLALHGATMHGRQMARPLLAAADDNGVALLVPDSRGPTWDVLLGGYGADIAFISDALAVAFDRCAIDPEQLSIGGISDGASYALSLGLSNGELFRSVIALSPGFAAPPAIVGRPRVFLSHGVGDAILPIDRCGRPIAAGLKKSGYEIDYREFDGGHEMPPAIVSAALTWLVR
ncbi:MAG TPA: hypothetical protein VNB24_09500 [Acidimicrobiales bacterium]|nr:hypothetical protein [Acidimicrobiales bacterium]